MKEIPQNIKDLFQMDNRYAETPKSVRFRFYGGDINLLYPAEDLYPTEDLFPIDDTPLLTIDVDQGTMESLQIDQSLCEENTLKFGECIAAMVTAILADVQEDLTGKEFVLSIEAGGYEMMMGIYQVDSFVRQADLSLVKIEAYDRMRKFHVDVAEWYQGLTFPMTLKQFRSSLCAHVGIIQQDASLPLDEMLVTKTIDPQQLFGLNVIKAICEINGCFGQMDEIGRLKYVFLEASGLFPSEELFPADDLFPAEMEGEHLSGYNPSGTTYEDYLSEGISQVQIRQEEGDVGAVYGDGSNTYIIQGNFLVYGKSAEELGHIASVTYEHMAHRVYRPCKIVTPALPWVEPGDGIICHTSDDVIETYCLKRTIKGIQAMMDTFEAKGTKEQKESFGILDQIIQLEGKSAVIKKSVEEVSVRVTNLKEYTEAQIKIMADNITLEVTRAKDEEAKLAASIKIQAGLIEAKVSKGEVSSQLSIEPDAIKLRTNRLSWESDNSSMTQDGTLTCQNIRAINGRFSGILESDYIGGDDSGAYLGDYSVSDDGTNLLESSNGFVKIDCKAAPDNWPIGNYATMHISGSGSSGVTLDGGTGKIECGEISCHDVKAINCSLAHGSSRIWGLGETIDWFWAEFEDLRNKVDNMS